MTARTRPREVSPRARTAIRTLLVAAVAMLLVGAFAEERGDAPAWTLAVSMVGFVTAIIAQGIDTLLRRHVGGAIATLCTILLGASAALSHFGQGQPDWFVAAAFAVLVVLVIGAVPTLILVIRGEQDERERAIVSGAASFAFVVTMMVVAVLGMVGNISDGVPKLTPTWVVLTGTVAFGAATVVLRGRM